METLATSDRRVIFMENLSFIFQILPATGFGIYIILYYKGWIPLSDEKEKVRQGRIKQYGDWPLLMGFLLVCISLFLIVFELAHVTGKIP